MSCSSHLFEKKTILNILKAVNGLLQRILLPNPLLSDKTTFCYLLLTTFRHEENNSSAPKSKAEIIRTLFDSFWLIQWHWKNCKSNENNLLTLITALTKGKAKQKKWICKVMSRVVLRVNASVMAFLGNRRLLSLVCLYRHGPLHWL